MNKTEFIKALSSQANLSLKDASAAVDGFIEVVATALKEGDKVAISGLGTFELKEKAARKGINPLTKEEITIPATWGDLEDGMRSFVDGTGTGTLHFWRRTA